MVLVEKPSQPETTADATAGSHHPSGWGWALVSPESRSAHAHTQGIPVVGLHFATQVSIAKRTCPLMVS